MRLYTVEENNELRILVSVDGGEKKYRLTDLGYDYSDMNDVICRLSADDFIIISENCKAMDASKSVDMKGVKLMAPIPFPRQDVLCLGLNYDEHAKEAKNFSDVFDKGQAYTIYFSKRVNRATADGEAIPAYTGYVDSLDYESELGMIISKDAKNVKAADAYDYIFGYTIINDISARNIQTRHKQWYLGKSLDGFTPMGPCIVTADEIGDVEKLRVSSIVNGETRQNGNTKFMIRTLPEIIEDVTQGMTLKAGSVIATGTPAGVGMGMNPPVFLKPGDVVTCAIENIGSITNVIE